MVSPVNNDGHKSNTNGNTQFESVSVSNVYVDDQNTLDGFQLVEPKFEYRSLPDKYSAEIPELQIDHDLGFVMPPLFVLPMFLLRLNPYFLAGLAIGFVISQLIPRLVPIAPFIPIDSDGDDTTETPTNPTIPTIPIDDTETPTEPRIPIDPNIDEPVKPDPPGCPTTVQVAAAGQSAVGRAFSGYGKFAKNHPALAGILTNTVASTIAIGFADGSARAIEGDIQDSEQASRLMQFHGASQIYYGIEGGLIHAGLEKLLPNKTQFYNELKRFREARRMMGECIGDIEGQRALYKVAMSALMSMIEIAVKAITRAALLSYGWGPVHGCRQMMGLRMTADGDFSVFQDPKKRAEYFVRCLQVWHDTKDLGFGANFATQLLPVEYRFAAGKVWDIGYQFYQTMFDIQAESETDSQMFETAAKMYSVQAAKEIEARDGDIIAWLDEEPAGYTFDLVGPIEEPEKTKVSVWKNK